MIFSLMILTLERIKKGARLPSLQNETIALLLLLCSCIMSIWFPSFMITSLITGVPYSSLLSILLLSFSATMPLTSPQAKKHMIAPLLCFFSFDGTTLIVAPLHAAFISSRETVSTKLLLFAVVDLKLLNCITVFCREGLIPTLQSRG